MWFVFGYAKSSRSGIVARELAGFRLLAKHVLTMSADDVDRAVEAGALEEVCDAMTKCAKRYGSGALAAEHETASDLHAAGLLDMQTMRTFDDLCLTPIEAFTPQQIHELRLREHASQAVFARYLNVTPSTVSQWERGEKRPRGPSLKLLTLVAKGGLRSIA